MNLNSVLTWSTRSPFRKWRNSLEAKSSQPRL